MLLPTVRRNVPQSVLKHLRWLIQKDKLGQDVFLIGPPGPQRRLLAMSYLELTQREIEFVTLTRDTTDTDLKQRREIKSGSSFYHDQVRVCEGLKWMHIDFLQLWQWIEFIG